MSEATDPTEFCEVKLMLRADDRPYWHITVRSTDDIHAAIHEAVTAHDRLYKEFYSDDAPPSKVTLAHIKAVVDALATFEAPPLTSELEGVLEVEAIGGRWIALAESKNYIERFKGGGNAKYCELTEKGKELAEAVT